MEEATEMWWEEPKEAILFLPIKIIAILN
jgi:hypothetical protein